MKSEHKKNILVMGIGNYLMGDEGVGIHTINALIQEKLPENVELLDGGTGGFHLLSYLESYPVIIMIDATMDGQPAGTIKLITPKFASDFPKALSAHDIGLKDLVESIVLIKEMPKIYLFTLSVVEIQSMTTTISSELRKAVKKVVTEVLNLLEKLNSDIPLEPNNS